MSNKHVLIIEGDIATSASDEMGAVTTRIPRSLIDQVKKWAVSDIASAVVAVGVVGRTSLFLSRSMQRVKGLLVGSATGVFQSVDRICEIAEFSRWDEGQFYMLVDELERVLLDLSSADATKQRLALAEWGENPEVLVPEVLGWERFLSLRSISLVDVRDNLIENTYECLYRIDGRMFLVATCGTGKLVILPVGDDVKSCEHAQAWLYGNTVVGLPLPRFFSRGRS